MTLRPHRRAPPSGAVAPRQRFRRAAGTGPRGRGRCCRRSRRYPRQAASVDRRRGPLLPIPGAGEHDVGRRRGRARRRSSRRAAPSPPPTGRDGRRSVCAAHLVGARAGPRRAGGSWRATSEPPPGRRASSAALAGAGRADPRVWSPRVRGRVRPGRRRDPCGERRPHRRAGETRSPSAGAARLPPARRSSPSRGTARTRRMPLAWRAPHPCPWGRRRRPARPLRPAATPPPGQQPAWSRAGAERTRPAPPSPTVSASRPVGRSAPGRPHASVRAQQRGPTRSPARTGLPSPALPDPQRVAVPDQRQRI